MENNGLEQPSFSQGKQGLSDSAARNPARLGALSDENIGGNDPQLGRLITLFERANGVERKAIMEAVESIVSTGLRSSNLP